MEAKIQELERAKKFERIKDFEMLDELGSGNFTVIYKTREIATNEFFAIKVANKNKLIKLHKEKEPIVEKHCLKKLEGIESVVQLKETFQDELNLYLLMELVEGRELWHEVNIFGWKDKRKIYACFAQILRAVSQLHKKGIVHRDLKPENIMLTNDNNKVKLIDFGSAKDVVGGVASLGNSSTGRVFYEHFVGTPQYMAPECAHNAASDPPCDVYALACVFYNMLVGFPPFVGRSHYLVFKAALENKPLFYDFLFDEFEVEWVLKALEKLPENRPKIDQFLAAFESRAEKFESGEKNLCFSSEKISAFENVLKKVKNVEKMSGEEIQEFVDAQKSEWKEKFQNDFEANDEKHFDLLAKQLKQNFQIEDFEHQAI